MCFRLGSCFGGGPDDFGAAHSTSTPKAPRGGGRKGANRGLDDHKAAGTYYNNLPASDEAWRKAYHDAPRDNDGRGYGYPAAHDSGYPAATEATKLAARNNNKVGDDHYAG